MKKIINFLIWSIGNFTNWCNPYCGYCCCWSFTEVSGFSNHCYYYLWPVSSPHLKVQAKVPHNCSHPLWAGGSSVPCLPRHSSSVLHWWALNTVLHDFFTQTLMNNLYIEILNLCLDRITSPWLDKGCWCPCSVWHSIWPEEGFHQEGWPCSYCHWMETRLRLHQHHAHCVCIRSLQPQCLTSEWMHSSY